MAAALDPEWVGKTTQLLIAQARWNGLEGIDKVRMWCEQGIGWVYHDVIDLPKVYRVFQ
jgi:hypothetical protein